LTRLSAAGRFVGAGGARVCVTSTRCARHVDEERASLRKTRAERAFPGHGAEARGQAPWAGAGEVRSTRRWRDFDASKSRFDASARPAPVVSARSRPPAARTSRCGHRGVEIAARAAW